eukprot:TRINITY_DN32724_c0_g1_i1.p3 TRINITY_DN32724_c0_g1~~TRINITY_DN32724_c0_g1_i1.p3  ORF type:complete len:113 (+),score=42.40 TRINITY_DN32724_c0_g1_i1:50-388(+)
MDAEAALLDDALLAAVLKRSQLDARPRAPPEALRSAASCAPGREDCGPRDDVRRKEANARRMAPEVALPEAHGEWEDRRMREAIRLSELTAQLDHRRRMEEAAELSVAGQRQ